jgi:hypothetical protein
VVYEIYSMSDRDIERTIVTQIFRYVHTSQSIIVLRHVFSIAHDHWSSLLVRWLYPSFYIQGEGEVTKKVIESVTT